MNTIQTAIARWPIPAYIVIVFAFQPENGHPESGRPCPPAPRGVDRADRPGHTAKSSTTMDRRLN